MTADNSSKMVVAGNTAGITAREEVEQVLAVFRTADGAEVTYDTYVEVYAAIRPHCQSADDCNECSLHVFQILDNEDLPRGVTRAMIVDCAIQAHGDVHTMESLIEQLLENKAPLCEGEKRTKSALEAHISGVLGTPVDHGIVYRPEDGASPEDEGYDPPYDEDDEDEVDVEDDMLDGGDGSDDA